MDTIYYYIDGPLIWFSFLFMTTSVVIRIAFYLYQTIKSQAFRDFKNLLLILLRWVVPLHRLLIIRPVYTCLRYFFHGCLFILPIGLAAHIELIAESTLGWYWNPLPDHIADLLIKIIILIICLFFLRRSFLANIRRISSAKDYLLILLTGLPFITGYLLTHSTPIDSIKFFNEHLYIIHVLSAEMMFIMTAFLFLGMPINKERCIACGACILNCPNAALELIDAQSFRKLLFSPCFCICCGTCVSICPEQAPQLRHDISFLRFLRLFKKEELITSELVVCEQCKIPSIPILQLRKLQNENETHCIEPLCAKCKQIGQAQRLDKYGDEKG